MHQQGYQPNQPGSRQSRTSNLHPGQDSPQRQSGVTSQTRMKLTRDTEDTHPADYDRPSRLKRQPNQKSRSTTKRRTSLPPSRNLFSLKSTILRRKPHTRFGPTRPAVSQSNRAVATNTSWYWSRATVQQYLPSPQRTDEPEKWYKHIKSSLIASM
jgi:hypothetical protein